MRRTRISGSIMAGMALTGALVGAEASRADAVLPPLGTRVMGEIARAYGPQMALDDSAATECVIGRGAPVVDYRLDQIAVRSNGTPAQIGSQVAAALHTLGSHATVSRQLRLTFPVPTSSPAIIPLVYVTLIPATGETTPIVKLARALNAQGVINRASPDYALSPESGPTAMWPNGFPQPASQLPAPRTSASGAPGAGETVWLFDTGVPSANQALIPTNLTRLSSTDDEVLDANNDGIVDLYYGGHSVAIAGVIRTLSPGVRVQAARITGNHDVVTDSSAAVRMSKALKTAQLNNAWPGVVLASFGTPACDINPRRPTLGQLAPVGTMAIAQFVAAWGRTSIVSAAGNRSSSRLFYPAAYPGVIAVGAMNGTADGDGNAFTSASRTDPRASFSNFGTWVDAWAPGQELVTSQVRGLKFASNQPVLNGVASVDGTSFAAPYVAALIAERLRNGDATASAAFGTLKAFGRACSQANGGGLALALVSPNAAATTPGAAGTPVEC